MIVLPANWVDSEKPRVCNAIIDKMVEQGHLPDFDYVTVENERSRIMRLDWSQLWPLAHQWAPELLDSLVNIPENSQVHDSSY